MKTKNLILGIVAFTFAIGSAFASLTLDSNVWVKVYTSQADFEEGIDSCVDTGVSCADSSFGVRCSVQVSLQNGTTPTTDKTYKNSGCTVQILGNTYYAPLSEMAPVYALAE